MKSTIVKYNGKLCTLKEYFPVILLFIFLVGFVIYSILKKGNYSDVYLSSQFDEKIIDVYEEKGYVYLLLTNKSNRYKLENCRNYEYKPAFLSNFLKENDRVIKKQCSDTIYIERGLKKYHFLIGSKHYNNKEKSKEFIHKYNSERTIMNEKNDCE